MTNVHFLHRIWFAKTMPISAYNFIDLAEKGFYNGLHFHRLARCFTINIPFGWARWNICVTNISLFINISPAEWSQTSWIRWKNFTFFLSIASIPSLSSFIRSDSYPSHNISHLIHDALHLHTHSVWLPVLSRPCLKARWHWGTWARINIQRMIGLQIFSCLWFKQLHSRLCLWICPHTNIFPSDSSSFQPICRNNLLY